MEMWGSRRNTETKRQFLFSSTLLLISQTILEIQKCTVVYTVDTGWKPGLFYWLYFSLSQKSEHNSFWVPGQFCSCLSGNRKGHKGHGALHSYTSISVKGVFLLPIVYFAGGGRANKEICMPLTWEVSEKQSNYNCSESSWQVNITFTTTHEHKETIFSSKDRRW